MQLKQPTGSGVQSCREVLSRTASTSMFLLDTPRSVHIESHFNHKTDLCFSASALSHSLADRCLKLVFFKRTKVNF